MFSLKNFKLVNKLKNAKQQLNWLTFSNKNKINKNKFMSSVIADNKFVEEDLKLRAMVEDMIKAEFGNRLTNHTEYEFLVDSVVHKLKQQQLGKVEPLEEM